MRPKILLLLLVAVSLAGWGSFHYLKTGGSPGVQSQPISEISVAPTASQQARQRLTEVIEGKRKPPRLGGKDWERYYTLTQKWIGSLSRSDCVALIDLAEIDQSDVLRQELYHRFGELDPQDALLRISKCLESDGMKNYLTTSMLHGWGKSQPDKAWNYLMGFNEEDGYSKLSNGGTPESAAREIMEAWANKDAASAYASLLKAPRALFMHASCGYYYGLSDSVNFEFESRQLEALLDPVSAPKNLSSGWFSPDDPPERRLPIALGTKWANHDPEAAMAWWLKVDEDVESWTDKEEWRAYRTAQFVNEWAGVYVEQSPERALEWINSHPELLQQFHFQEVALPAFARWLPEKAIDLIRLIALPERQAAQLHRLTRAPVFSGADQYRRQEPSAILPPDLVERSLGKFTFTEEEGRMVAEAIKARREYEANQPVLSPSGW